MKRTTLVFICAVLPITMLAQQVRPHTEFRVKLTGPLSTQANKKGDKLAAQVISPKQFAGSTLEGEITDCKSKGLFHRNAVLNFTFKTLHTRKAAIPITSDVKLFSNSRGKNNVDDHGTGVERTSEKLTADAAAAKAAAGKALGGAAKTVISAGLVSAIVVQLSAKEKDISFAPGSQFVLDVSLVGGTPQDKTTKKPVK